MGPSFFVFVLFQLAGKWSTRYKCLWVLLRPVHYHGDARRSPMAPLLCPILVLAFEQEAVLRAEGGRGAAEETRAPCEQ